MFPCMLIALSNGSKNTKVSLLLPDKCDRMHLVLNETTVYLQVVIQRLWELGRFPHQKQLSRLLERSLNIWKSVRLVQAREDIFGRREEVESIRFHSTLILSFLKECQFYTKFKFFIIVIIAQLSTLCFITL